MSLAAIMVALAGCAAGPKVDPNAASAAFREQLSMTTTAINAGDLTAARDSLGKARAAATSPVQLQKVGSLDQLIQGAEALRAGDPDGAKAAWSRIEEPHLAREVRHKARLIGLEVPMAPVEEGQTR